MPTRPRFVIAAVIAVVLVAVVAAGGWYVFLRDDAPPPVSLEGAVASTQATPAATATPSPAATPTATPTSTPAPTEAATQTAATETAAAEATASRAEGDLTGAWQLSAQGESFAGFRVREQLVTVGAFTAVGRSTELTASLEFDGSAITAVNVEVDMTALTTDDSRRDRALRSQAIETSRFPTSSFVLAEPIAIASVPAGGETISVTAVGDLTLHGVTQRVEIPIEGQFTGGLVIVVGSLEIVFEDYDIDPPSAPIVLSVEDRGIMEFQLVFE